MAQSSQAGAESPRAKKPPVSSFDALLIGVTVSIALLVAALLAAFTAQSQLHARTLETISLARTVRDEAVSIAQALADVEAARRGAALTRERIGATHPAKVETLAHVTILQERCQPHQDLAQIAERIGALVAADFDQDGARLSPQAAVAQSQVYRSELRQAFEELRTSVNALNDDARSDEHTTRQRLDAMAIALGVLALLGAALAGFALRRERKHWRIAHAATEEAYASAAASDLAKSRFLAVASHDMRQPLHALTLYLTALERRVDTDEARDIVAKMDRAVHSMSGMFTSLLELARLQAGVVTPDLTDAHLRHVIAIAIAEHAEDKVSTDVADIRVHTDQRLLARLISNLISNAIRHGGGRAMVTAHAENGAAVICVSDTGPGIAATDHERIFEEFERLDANADGLGLGLPIVRRLAALLGATVTLESTEGQGARFTVRLQTADTQAATQPSSAADADALRGVRVLVMDDDALAREAIGGLLTDLHADVRTCSDGEEAEALLRAGFTPQLLLLDLRIRGKLSGLDIGHALSAKLDPPPRTIMVTGDVEPETLAALQESGFAWLIKPVGAQDLRDVAVAQLSGA